MSKSRNIVLLAMVMIMGLWAFWELQIYANNKGGVGADVIVGSIPSIDHWGPVNDEMAFSIGTTSCNIGDENLEWFASPSNRHPVIGQNLYRVKDGRIEQIGMSWLKHGFLALAGSLCDSCQDPNTGTLLGVGCSDPYSAGLNGNRNRLGPRGPINAATGFFPTGSPPSINVTSSLDGRIRVPNSDLDPTLNPGARYFVEGHYIHPQDAEGGNDDNNASYREAFVTAISGGFNLNTAGSEPNNPPLTVREHPGIMAWQAVYPDVQLFFRDIPGDGRVIIGILTTPAESGEGFRSEIAIQNLNSHRSVRSLGVKFCSGTAFNPGFNDVDYQQDGDEGPNGPPYSGTDWAPTINGDEIEWSTQTFDTNEDANALRWGTIYSFWCDSNDRPSELTLGLFRPGTPTEITVDLAEAIPADMMTVFRGVLTGGTLADTQDSDDSYATFRAGFTAGTSEAPVWLVFDANLPTDSPDFLNLVVESSAATPGMFSTTLEAWNWNTNSYDVVDVSNASVSTDTVTKIDLTSGLSDYVQSGGAVRARVGWRATGLIAAFPWFVQLDQFIWQVEPQ